MLEVKIQGTFGKLPYNPQNLLIGFAIVAVMLVLSPQTSRKLRHSISKVLVPNVFVRKRTKTVICYFVNSHIPNKMAILGQIKHVELRRGAPRASVYKRKQPQITKRLCFIAANRYVLCGSRRRHPRGSCAPDPSLRSKMTPKGVERNDRRISHNKICAESCSASTDYTSVARQLFKSFLVTFFQKSNTIHIPTF